MFQIVHQESRAKELLRRLSSSPPSSSTEADSSSVLFQLEQNSFIDAIVDVLHFGDSEKGEFSRRIRLVLVTFDGAAHLTRVGRDTGTLWWNNALDGENALWIFPCELLANDDACTVHWSNVCVSPSPSPSSSSSLSERDDNATIIAPQGGSGGGRVYNIPVGSGTTATTAPAVPDTLLQTLLEILNDPFFLRSVVAPCLVRITSSPVRLWTSPQVVLYHGTSVDCAHSICTDGALRAQLGMMGRKVYLANAVKAGQRFALRRSDYTFRDGMDFGIENPEKVLTIQELVSNLHYDATANAAAVVRVAVHPYSLREMKVVEDVPVVTRILDTIATIRTAVEEKQQDSKSSTSVAKLLQLMQWTFNVLSDNTAEEEDDSVIWKTFTWWHACISELRTCWGFDPRDWDRTMENAQTKWARRQQQGKKQKQKLNLTQQQQQRRRGNNRTRESLCPSRGDRRPAPPYNEIVQSWFDVFPGAGKPSSKAVLAGKWFAQYVWSSHSMCRCDRCRNRLSLFDRHCATLHIECGQQQHQQCAAAKDIVWRYIMEAQAVLRALMIVRHDCCSLNYWVRPGLSATSDDSSCKKVIVRNEEWALRENLCAPLTVAFPFDPERRRLRQLQQQQSQEQQHHRVDKSLNPAFPPYDPHGGSIDFL